MLGVIRKRHVISHPLVTIQCFGWRVFVKTLFAGRKQTFLSVLMGTDILEKPRIEVSETVERCVQLELRARNLYRRLGRRFSKNPEVGGFFETIAQQEQQHAELLELCREVATRTGWTSERFEPCAEAVPALEEEMSAAESFLDGDLDLSDALRLTVQIESSEVNRVFQGVIASCDCEFVRTLKTFHSATASHLTYIRHRIVELEPDLEDACRAMSEKYTTAN